jgi:hypothetical protein
MYGNPQIHAESEHYPEQKWAICLTVIHRVRSIYDTDGTDEEISLPIPDFQVKFLQQPGHHTRLASNN